MPQGVEFRLGVDGSQAIAALSAVQNKMAEVGKTAREELAQKLKTVFTVAAIEEATRRTADWAQEIEQTSKQIGISAEALQALQLIASKTGLPSDSVTGMFENIAKAREEALKGNKDLIVSFQKLGVTLSDLQSTTKSELFGKVLSSIPNNVEKADNFTRQAVSDVTGQTPENFIDAIKGEVGNQPFGTTSTSASPATGYIGAGVNSGAIQPEQNIGDLAATWTQFKQTLKQLGTELTPIVTFLVSLLNTLVKAIAGIVDVFTNFFGLAKGLFTGNGTLIVKSLANIGSLIANAGFGIAKILTGLMDFLATSILKVITGFTWALSKVPVIGKYFKATADHAQRATEKSKGMATSVVQKAQDATNRFLAKGGATSDVAEHGEAVGNVAAILGTDGIAAVSKTATALTAKGVQAGLMKVATGAEKLGMTGVADASLTGATKAEAFASKVTAPRLTTAEAEANMKAWLNQNLENQREAFKRFPSQSAEDVAGRNKFLGDRNAEMTGSGVKAQQDIVRAVVTRGGVGIASAIMAGLAAMKAVQPKHGTSPAETTPILPRNGYFQDFNGSKPSMLSLGGTFGSGFQSRIIQLNQQMVNYLATITRYLGPTNNPPSQPNGNPNSFFAGGR